VELTRHADTHLAIRSVDSTGRAHESRTPLPGLPRSSPVGVGRARWDATVWRQAVEHAQLICLIVDCGGRLIERSAAAASVLGGRNALRLQGGRLAASTVQDTERLRRQIALAAMERRADQPQYTFYLGPLHLQVAPVRVRGENLLSPGYSDCVLILIRRRTRRRPPSAAAIRTQLRCTPAEAQVAAALAAGYSPRQIAAQRGVSIYTIRAQVRALFAITSTRRIGELVAFIVGV
jgi:DNA-binding CsgD family transcriptional regulator